MRLIIIALILTHIHSFYINNVSIRPKTILQSKKKSSSSHSSSRGFGKSAKSIIKVRQTYGSTQKPRDELIDTEGAMKSFFNSKEEWHPLFASLVSADNVPALDFLNGLEIGDDLAFEDETPWRKLPQVPEGDNKDEQMAAIAKVLDSWQQALVDIPVNEASKEDVDDMHFIEEGRRILCMNSYHL